MQVQWQQTPLVKNAARYPREISTALLRRMTLVRLFAPLAWLQVSRALKSRLPSLNARVALDFGNLPFHCRHIRHLLRNLLRAFHTRH